ncbi:DNA helicase [Corynebacterium phage phi673]|uniref:Putative helicase n=1 Tax=Corynebacterium phage phi673 TaxID=2052821 RepID=A0A2H4PJ53_9CAUD|nr:DNA helicase [Corynebacterium phage phi673]ATW62905.1 putative helicase [Corynebacterium phage phi673]
MNQPRQLRPYQTEAVHAVYMAWNKGERTCVVLPTGTGKSTVIAKIAVDAIRTGARVLLLAHRRELLDQMAASIFQVDPELPEGTVGFVQAERDQPGAPIVAASFQTLASAERLTSLGERHVVITDECFVAGTMVDGKPIEDYTAGDYVRAVNSKGETTLRKVFRTMSSTPNGLVTVHLADGQSFTCTPGHPFLTDNGWVVAAKLVHGVRLHHAQSRVESTSLHSVREAVPNGEEIMARPMEQGEKSVLLRPLPGHVCSESKLRDHGEDESEVRLKTDDREQPNEGPGNSSESVRNTQEARTQTDGTRREWSRDNSAPTCTGRSFEPSNGGDNNTKGWGAPTQVQCRPCRPGCEALCGGRWREPRYASSTACGCSQGRTTSWVRVDHVEVHEQTSDGTFGGMCPDRRVYNLEIEEDHTYTVGTGITVHNCHHSAAETYAEVLGKFPDAFKAGFTATLQRSDGGLGDLWDSVAFERSLKWALEEGFLVTPRGKTVVIPSLDTTKLKIRNGDYAAGELSDAMMVSVDSCVEAIHTHAGNRRMLIFGAGVEHCEALADNLSRSGIPTAVVVGSTPSEERKDLFEDFTAGRVQALVTVQVLTEGTDLPACDCVVLARPTRSPVLFTQMVGRALRLHRHKEDALVLDLAGATRDVSMVTLSSLVEGVETTRVSPSSDEDPGQEEPAPPRPQREGAIDMVDVDLLTASNAVWLSTRIPEREALDGIPFLDGQNGWYAYLLPAGGDDLFAVGIVPGTSQPSYLLAGGAIGTRDQAREAAEHEINRHAVLPLKTAGWRSRPTPSEGQVTFGQSLGIEGAERMKKARLSDEISTVLASRQLRKFFK